MALAFAAVGGATASSDASTTGLGGTLPLKSGVYVGAETSCGSPPNAAIRIYDGVGISGSPTHASRTTVLSRVGTIHRVSQSCIDAPSGSYRRTAERQTVVVRGAGCI